MLRSFFIMACVLLLSISAMAGDFILPEQLVGDWMYAQRASSKVYVDTLTIEMDTDGLSGVMEYMNGGKDVQDSFNKFEFLSRRRVNFLSTRPNGRSVRHTAEMSEDGNSILGQYNLGFGVGGSFVMNRIGVDGPPSMSGGWVYYVVDPAGGSGLYGDATLLCDATGNCKGYLDYRTSFDGPKITVENVSGKQTFVMYTPETEYSKNLKGTITKSSDFEFSMYDNGKITHTGKLSKDGTRIDGIWENPKLGKGQFVLMRATE